MAVCAGEVYFSGVRTPVRCTEGVLCTGKCTQALLSVWTESFSYFQDGVQHREEETLGGEAAQKVFKEGEMDSSNEEESCC